MSYNLTLLEDINFKSPLTLIELTDRLKSFDENLSEEWVIKILNEDAGNEDKSINQFFLQPTGEDYYGKFDTHDIVDKFISSVISNGHHAVIEWQGENGERWGSLIFHTNPFDRNIDHWQIYDISYTPMVKGVELYKFIKKHQERGVDHAERKNRKVRV